MRIFCQGLLYEVDFASVPMAMYSAADKWKLGQTKELSSPGEDEDVGSAMNQFPQHNPVARREMLKKLTELGLSHMKGKEVSTTILGHKIVLQDLVADVAGVVGWAENYIKDAAKDLPYASIIVAGVCLVLPLLKNPTAVEQANRDGFIYVTGQIRYYSAMESLLLPENMKADLKADLTERLVDLYKKVIDFQVQSILRFYRSRTKNFLRGTINYDGWASKVREIKECDADLISKFQTTLFASKLDFADKNIRELRSIAEAGQASRKALENVIAKMQQQIEVSQETVAVLKNIDQHVTDPQDNQCLQDLCNTDPRSDKSRIEEAKGHLLAGSYRWVLDSSEFKKWYNSYDNQLLWVTGEPGKGKTMLLCGLIDEMTPSTALADPDSRKLLSYFFCQATEARLNNGAAVLRGLIYMIVHQQRNLISHVRRKYDRTGKQLFEDINAWEALSEIFVGILNDPSLQTTYLVIDGLDECGTAPQSLSGDRAIQNPQYTDDLLRLLRFISVNSTRPQVKWIVSSRNWQSIKEKLSQVPQNINLCLEANGNSVSATVSVFIEYKVRKLAQDNKYDNDTQAAVQRHLELNAEDTFLWVALVCQELAYVRRRHVLKKLNAFPPGLNELYRRMINQIGDHDDAQLCKRILAIVSTVYRPVTLDELWSFLEEDDLDDESLIEIVGYCGSFLTLRHRTVLLVHQSAKDFLLDKAAAEIMPSGLEDMHNNIFLQSINTMSNTLRRDIFDLRHPGLSIDDMKPLTRDPLAKARYACVYWVDHMYKAATCNLEDNGCLHKFLRQYCLYWLESLSLLGSISQGILSMAKLDGLLQVRLTLIRVPLKVLTSCRGR